MLGGYVTILLGLVVLLSSVFILSQYFNKEAPIVTTSVEYHSNYTEFDLYEQELFAPVNILVGGTLIPAQGVTRYITAQIEMEEYSFNNQTKNYQLKTTHTYQYVPCDILKDRKVLDFIDKVNSVASELRGYGLCPDFKSEIAKYRAVRNLSSSTYYSPKLSIYPCSLSDQSLCASAQELSYATISYASIEKLIVSSNFEKPVSRLPDTKRITVDLSLKKVRQLELRNNHLEDDTAVFNGPVVKEEFVTQHQVEADFKLRPVGQTYCSPPQIALAAFGGCQQYFLLNYSPSGKIQKIKRSYRKLTMILGELGGFVKLVTTIVFLLYSFYNAWSVKNFIAKKLYHLGDSKGSSNKSKLFSTDSGNNNKEKSQLSNRRNRISDYSVRKK